MTPLSAPSTSGAPVRIRQLPPLVASQIAAGEVVERPASVVKELLDNAIDAGATRITVELEQGGVELIRISDDGRGIVEGDLRLALTPHATSKITGVDDLDRIATMGFRGEALASILAVSRVTLRSRTADQAGACEIAGEGDRIGEARPAPGPVGTTITVRNLFFNTPARRKFLRTPQTEQGRCADAVRDLAMSHPAIGFTLTCDGRRTIDLPPDQSPHQRAIDILGRELKDQLIEIEADGRTLGSGGAGLAIWGLAGLPSIARATLSAQHVFINGRPIRDRTIQHAIREAYRGLIEPGRHPTAVVMLEMDPGAVDVNVHPTKAEVRFRDSSLIHGTVFRAVRDALHRADLTPSFTPMAATVPFGPRAILPSAAPVAPAAGAGPARQDPTAAFVDYISNRLPNAAGADSGGVTYERLREAVTGADSRAPEGVAPAPVASAAGADAAMLAEPKPADRILQVHNSFLVTQDSQGVVIIDQHALHERVMFEALLARIGSGNLESQRMLTPAVVQASARDFEILPAMAPLLARIGVEMEQIGPDALGVQSFPTFLFDRGVEVGPFIRELLDRATGVGGGGAALTPNSEEALHEVLDMMACKAAVKAGDRLSEPELARLVELRDAVERSSNCPHGRPTSIRVSIRELEKWFGRT